MLSLREIQHYFKDAVLNNEKNKLIDHIVESHLPSEKRLQIYHNNIFVTLTKTLQNIYPSIQRLVGEDFFAATSEKYILENPSTYKNLNHYGSNFPEFLATFPHTQTLPYLPEVAQLEWAYQEAYHGENASSFDWKKLKSVREEEYGKLLFALHPTAQLFTFQFPVSRIWQFCQKEKIDMETVDLDDGGEYILITRRQLDVTIEKISEGEYALLSAFKKEKNFEESCMIATTVEPALDIQAHLEKHILLGTITHFI